jgi:hypothetical protein
MSVHPALIHPLAKLIVRASRDSQVWITTHSQALAEAIQGSRGLCRSGWRRCKGRRRSSTAANWNRIEGRAWRGSIRRPRPTWISTRNQTGTDHSIIALQVSELKVDCHSARFDLRITQVGLRGTCTTKRLRSPFQYFKKAVNSSGFPDSNGDR